MPTLKRLEDQVVVITGATSGIGLATARRAAARGARLVLVARNREALDELAGELRLRADVRTVDADVADEDAMQGVADAAIQAFGGFDTWVNNAGVSIYGHAVEMPLDEQRRLFDTNFWGVVIGSRIAARHLTARGGGAIVNLGSIVSDRAVPMQAAYVASKHAIKGYTDALRMELEHDRAPVSVTLVKPAAIDTPYPQHARNHMERAPTNPAPLYAPRLVADAILHAAEHPVRSLTVGGGGWLMAALGVHFPALADRIMARMMVRAQQHNPGEGGARQDSLYESHSALRERGDAKGLVFERSLFTEAQKHPLATLALAVGGIALLRRLARP